MISEGLARFTIDGEQVEAGPDRIVFIPSGVPHDFVNAGTGILRIVAVHVAPKVEIEWIEKPWMRGRDRTRGGMDQGGASRHRKGKPSLLAAILRDRPGEERCRVGTRYHGVVGCGTEGLPSRSRTGCRGRFLDTTPRLAPRCRLGMTGKGGRWQRSAAAKPGEFAAGSFPSRVPPGSPPAMCALRQSGMARCERHEIPPLRFSLHDVAHRRPLRSG